MSSTTEDTSSKTRRVEVALSERAFQELTELVQQQRSTTAQVIQLGVALVKVLSDANRKGEKLLIVNAGGKPVREIVHPGVG